MQVIRQLRLPSIYQELVHVEEGDARFYTTKLRMILTMERSSFYIPQTVTTPIGAILPPSCSSH